MTNQPDFPADEPLVPADGCGCDSCQRLRDEAAAAAVAFGFHPVNKTTAATGQPDAKAPPGKESLACRNQKQVCDIRWCVLVPTENRISVTL